MLPYRLLASAPTRRLIFSALTHVQTSSFKFHTSQCLQAQTIKVPQMAESITEGTLRTWLKKVGDAVSADEEVATIETDKIDVSINAPRSGIIVKLLVDEDTTVTVGQELFILEDDEGSQGLTRSESHNKQTSLVAESLSDKGVSNDSSQDVKGKPSEDTKEVDMHPAVVPPQARTETRVKMNRMRLRIAERLKESQNIAASLTTFNEIDMSSLIEMRKKYKESVQKDHNVKLGFMSAFAKACSLALSDIPVANASIDGDEIVYHSYVDLSVAVATHKGLVTPIVRNAESMGLIQLEKEIASLGKKARDGKLALEDMAGGTFTISNGGVFGSLYGTPIINLPQSAVLGMHAIKERPMAVDGQIAIRPIMIVALTYDHRLLDGREAVTFLVRVKDYLEDPRKMLLA